MFIVAGDGDQDCNTDMIRIFMLHVEAPFFLRETSGVCSSRTLGFNTMTLSCRNDKHYITV